MVAVRAMAPSDLPETVDMWVAAWQAAYPAIDFEARRAWIAEHIAALARAGAQARVAVSDGRIVGLLVVNPASGDLDQLVVAADCQARGIGARLLDEARRLSPSVLVLHVNQDNARAIRFYETHGFDRTGTGVNPRSGAPVYRMRWNPP